MFLASLLPEMHNSLITMTVMRSYIVLFLFLQLCRAETSLVWEERTGYPGEGRHHPITFANETHAFLLTGTTVTNFDNVRFLHVRRSGGRVD